MATTPPEPQRNTVREIIEDAKQQAAVSTFVGPAPTLSLLITVIEDLNKRTEVMMVRMLQQQDQLDAIQAQLARSERP